MKLEQQKIFMLAALKATWQSKGVTLPNPCVGAALVKNGNLIGVASTQEPGQDHAEKALLRKWDGKGATLFVTLEPCCHFGRTPPCTDFIIQAKVAKVFVSVLDPNPEVAGKGVAQLRNAGIDVEVGVCQEEIEEYYKGFFHWIKHKQPRVVLKTAVSIDGFVANKDSSPMAITGAQTKKKVHALRALSDAILVGFSTLRHDNPKLDTRFSETIRRVPLLRIFVGQNKLSTHLQVWEEEGEKWIFSSSEQGEIENKKNVNSYLAKGTFEEVWLDILRVCGEQGLHQIFVEAGPTLLKKIVESQLWQEFILIQNKNPKKEGLALGKSLSDWKEGYHLSKFAVIDDDTWYHFQNEV